jgi:surface polysaccharide O-acyltransferase-like enzyme
MPDDVPRLSRRPARSLGLRRTRVDAFRVYAMLVVIVGHSEMLLGHTPDANVQGLRLVLNVVSRFAVPLFFILAGEHLGPRLLGEQGRATGRVYARRLVTMFAAASLVYWAVDVLKIARHRGLDAFGIVFRRELADPLHILLWGGSTHLWFLTVLLAVVLVANLTLVRRRVRTFVGGAVLAYGAGLMLGPYGQILGLPPGRAWFEWLLQCSLFFAVGVFLGLERQHPRRHALAAALIVGGLALHAAEVYWLSTAYGIPLDKLAMLAGTVPYAVGVALLAFSPGSSRADRWAARYSPYVPVVYLGHVFFLELLLPPRGQFPDLMVRLLLPLLTTVLSFGAAQTIGRWRIRVRRRRTRALTELA